MTFIAYCNENETIPQRMDYQRLLNPLIQASLARMLKKKD